MKAFEAFKKSVTLINVMSDMWTYKKMRFIKLLLAIITFLSLKIQMLPSEVDTALGLYNNNLKVFVWEETGMRTATNELCVGSSLCMSLCTVLSRTATYIRQLIKLFAFAGAALEGRDKACGRVQRCAGASKR